MLNRFSAMMSRRTVNVDAPPLLPVAVAPVSSRCRVGWRALASSADPESGLFEAQAIVHDGPLGPTGFIRNDSSVNAFSSIASTETNRLTLTLASAGSIAAHIAVPTPL